MREPSSTVMVTAASRPVSETDAETFQAVRPRLFSIAYRSLRSVVDADDGVHKTWMRWQCTDRSQVRDTRASLATATSRLAINVAQSARVRHETLGGPGLPERVDTGADPARDAERGEALASALLVLLQKLSPAERAAYLLRDAFATRTGRSRRYSRSARPMPGSTSPAREAGSCATVAVR